MRRRADESRGYSSLQKSPVKSREFLQKILLLFLVGFFFGAVFYYVFQNSFSEITGKIKEQSFLRSFLYSLWNHGKYFGLFWLLSGSRVIRIYQPVFILYTGLRNGFLIMFFIFGKGVRGILVYLISLFPHCLLLVPLYLFSFFLVKENRQKKHAGPVAVILLLVFLAACYGESRWNLPLMKTNL